MLPLTKNGIISLVLILGITVVYGSAVNSPAPVFVLTNSHHQKRALSDYKGKVVLINFWASWCAPCQVELPELNRLAAQYSAKNFRVLAINVDQDRASTKKLLAQLGPDVSNLEILWDPDSKTVSTYHIDGMPSSFIVDSHGIIAFTHVGFHRQDPDLWRQEIDHLIGKKS